LITKESIALYILDIRKMEPLITNLLWAAVIKNYNLHFTIYKFMNLNTLSKSY